MTQENNITEEMVAEANEGSNIALETIEKGEALNLGEAMRKVDPAKREVIQSGKIGAEEEKPAEVVPTLSQYELMEKQVMALLLAKWILPNKVSEKSTTEADVRALTAKLNRSTLPDLRRFFDNMPESVLIEIQRRYEDLSP